MFITVAGTPAGYGYFNINAVPGENIIPEMMKTLRNYDTNTANLGAPIQVGTMAIQVNGDTKVRVNDRSPILVQPDIGLTFDARGVYSLTFDTAVAYNITLSY